MTVEEKLRAMESLWDDLCRRAGGIESPAWHGEELARRKAQLEQGKDDIEDWETAKRNIRDKTA
jgi:hypothetical protein